MASIDKVPTGWRARYRTPEGASRSKTFARRTDADRFLTTVEHSKIAGAYLDPSAGRMTFGAFARQWLDAQTFDVSTREAVEVRLRVHILPTFGTLELRSIRPSTVQAWLRGRQAECAPRYVRVMLANLSGVLSAAAEDGLISRNPCAARSVRAPSVEQRRIVPWTAEIMAAVVGAHPGRYRAVPVVAAGCGLRQGETFGLRVEDVDFLRRRVLVRQQVKIVGGRLLLAPPKGGKSREVPLPDAVGVAGRAPAPVPAYRRTRVHVQREQAARPELPTTPGSGSRPSGRPACRRPARTGCTHCATTTPRCCSRPARASAPSRSTSATPTRASRCASTRT